MYKKRLIVYSLLLGSLWGYFAFAGQLFSSDSGLFKVETVVSGLDSPWSLEFLPDGRILVSERAGRLRIVEDGKLLEQTVLGLPAIAAVGQGGLLDIALDPNYNENQIIYFSYAATDGKGVGTEVAKAQLVDNQLKNLKRIFQLLPKSRASVHFGSRLLFAKDGRLFISLGDQGKRPRAQNLSDHAGTLIRINADGTVPNDNPFINQDGAQPEIYSYGHRNIQGIARQPGTDNIWTVEHGPQGGDELNLIGAGLNYGWPIITYGKNYGSGTVIGEGTEKKGLEQPVHYWVPSIATSSLLFYDGDPFPNWQGNAFVSSLVFGQLARLVIKDNKVIQEERLLNGEFGRIREVKQGPDGFIYLLTDGPSGKILRAIQKLKTLIDEPDDQPNGQLLRLRP